MSDTLGRRLLGAWPFVTLLALAVVFVLMLVFSRKAPVIAQLEPALAEPGQQVAIVGDYFGRTEREGSLSLAGEIPPPSLIQSWTDQRIVFTVPEDASSGLVTVSNSQGTSTGVLFTNTKSIPTVLQPASPRGVPVITALSPPRPASGQSVTLLGRSFGVGDPASLIRVLSSGGPAFEFGPAESLTWTDRSLSFEWPAGAGPGSAVEVVTRGGTIALFSVEASSPLVLEQPQDLVVEIRANTNLPSGLAAVLWGPVPQRSTGTVWTLLSAQPAPLPGSRPLAFRWGQALGGDRQASYRLSLTTWARRWDGFPAGVIPATAAPASDPRSPAWWKPAQPALKVLTAKWGLEVADPWLRLQRLHAGLASNFAIQASVGLLPPTRAPAEILSSGTLGGLEAATLAAALASLNGVPSRLVTGLYNDGTTLEARGWVELWFSGAGWVPWDPAFGPPGPLDNKHFAFSTAPNRPQRLEAQAEFWGSSPPWAPGEAAGEATWSATEPVVQWEIKRSQK